MKNLTRRARQLRNDMTDAELHLWRRFRGKQLCDHKFRHQSIIGSYIVDFVCHEAKLIIEVDGGQHANHATYDHQRDQWLNSQGFRVLRFWNNDMLNETDTVLETIYQKLNER